MIKPLKGAWTYVNSNYYEIKGMVNQKAKETETKTEDSEYLHNE